MAGVRFGLDVLQESWPDELRGKRVGVLAHAASIDSNYRHVIDIFEGQSTCRLSAIFGPQHGLFGQTQDNMIEWESSTHPRLGIPVFSLYGATRTPRLEMLEQIDVLVVDLQDVGARPYTYIWTIKNCCAACEAAGVPLWILDRPNPIGAVPLDGPMLPESHFSFVGGAEIPLCHRMTMGELATLLKDRYFPSLALQVVWMDGWWRNSLWNETGLPWVLPSPNMPTLDSAIVYPGMVLLEACNLSEGRGTTRPFELFGAPYLIEEAFLEVIDSLELPGCMFREHGFIPTFQKWQGRYCHGFQIHVTDPRVYQPVRTVYALLHAVATTSGERFAFNPPPYEYETEKMPIDILTGEPSLREKVSSREFIQESSARWDAHYDSFRSAFSTISHYPEERS